MEPSQPEHRGRVDIFTGRWLILAGTIAASLAMLGEARLGPRDPQASDPSSWWGILPSTPPTDTARGVLAATAALAVIALCLTWLLLLASALRHTLSTRVAALAALAWATPFAVGPPLFSRDVYAYSAQGELARHGLDPATHGIGALASRDAAGEIFVAAVDPRWRETHAPYGGLAVGVERLAAALGDALGTGPAEATVVLRIVAVISTVALVLLALRLVRGPAGAAAGATAATGAIGAPIVLALLAANPFVIIHLVGGAHLDALAAALLVGALVVDRMRRRPGAAGPRRDATRDRALGTAAVALACLAGSVKATAFLGLGWLLFVHVRDSWNAGAAGAGAGSAVGGGRAAGRRGAAVATTAGTLGADLLAGAGALAAAMAAGGYGPTWIGALATSGKLETGVAPASILATVLSALARLVGLDVADGTLLNVTRALALAAAGVTIAWLTLRSWSRPETGGHRDDLAVLGFGGMAVALGSPVVYPWYLALSVPFLAVIVALGRQAPPRRTRAVVGLVAVTSVWLCAATLSPLAATWRLLGRAGPAGAAVAVARGLVALLTAAG
ncbi:hypothetical protein UG55_10756, partial [Frankia sp. EI5c]|uniref:polyprenol phosphomannose-dependent alpha 1,6 mannosyltransferase MptB n=1 Tax=Frankia sp. EI5c TaxID=683316 RepID=UPI0007C25213